MAGTTGLEPATSAVTVFPFQVFQRLTNPWGTPKTTKVVYDHQFCGFVCGSKIEAALCRATTGISELYIIYAASIATTLDSLSVFTSRMGGWPKNLLYSRLNWLTLS